MSSTPEDHDGIRPDERPEGLAGIRPGNRLVPDGYQTDGRLRAFRKALTEGYTGRRIPVAQGTTWTTLDFQTYSPQDYTAYDEDNPPDWADPKDPRQSAGYPDFPSYEGSISREHDGRPVNPLGPTGIRGRGELGKWGRNHAVDPIVTRTNAGGYLELLVITRKNGQPALPGGMMEKGETVTEALERELFEETSMRVRFVSARAVYEGLVDDRRTTDNAWIETAAYHLHLTEGDHTVPDSSNDPDGESSSARWMVLTEESVAALYASHPDLVRRALALWERQTGFAVRKDGFVGLPA